MAGLTDNLVDFVDQIRFDDLPGSVVRAVKRTLLDATGCALGAYPVERARIALELVQDLGGRSQASIIGNDLTSCALAAFANGELINALDYEPVGPLVPHVCPFVIPAALASAERVNASGKDLIAAVAIGLEVGGRVGSSLCGHRIPVNEPPYYQESPRFSYSSTVFGAVAAAGKILGLTREAMANAFGIAGASTPVPATMKWEQSKGPAIMTKFNAWSGWIAQLATTAALAAEKGFTGDATILEGENGFWKIYGSPFSKSDNITRELGQTWHVNQVSFKAYPACGMNQTGIQALNQIILENNVDPETIESIVIQGDPLLLTPSRAGTQVFSFADTQFSNAYIFAVACFHGQKPGPAWQLRETYEDARVRELMKKVQVSRHPRAAELLQRRARLGGQPTFFDVIVELTAAGKRFVAETSAKKGTPQDPMTDEELKDKFRNNSSFSPIGRGDAEKLIEMIDSLETVVNVKSLMSVFRGSNLNAEVTE